MRALTDGLSPEFYFKLFPDLDRDVLELAKGPDWNLSQENLIVNERLARYMIKCTGKIDKVIPHAIRYFHDEEPVFTQKRVLFGGVIKDVKKWRTISSGADPEAESPDPSEGKRLGILGTVMSGLRFDEYFQLREAAEGGDFRVVSWRPPLVPMHNKILEVSTEEEERDYWWALKNRYPGLVDQLCIDYNRGRVSNDDPIVKRDSMREGTKEATYIKDIRIFEQLLMNVPAILNKSISLQALVRSRRK